MKPKAIYLGILFSIIFISCVDAQQNDFPVLQGSYFGQDPPGMTPELFAPKIFNAEHGYHSPVVFSPDFTEAVWSPMRRGECLMYSRVIDGQWSIPREVDFGLSMGVGDATFSPDGNRIYFCSFQPPEEGSPERERIWYTERVGADWSAPRLIDDVIRAHPTYLTFSFAENGNLYFTSEMPGVRGEQDIYLARFDGEKYLEPVDLGEAINSDGMDMAPFVARDESYLIFTRVGSTTRKADLYISFKGPNGEWTQAVDLGETLNTAHNDLAATVTRTGSSCSF